MPSRLPALALLTLALALSAAAQLLTASTESGRVAGTMVDDIAVAFYDIPYATPPVGELRFAPPQPAESWSPSVFDATVMTGVGCPQRCELPPGTCPTYQSEDCLKLSVTIPLSATPSSNLPVIVYLPGGHFQQGTESTELYGGQYLANATNVIVVAVNYRLGLLGFLVTGPITGNYGFLDQQLALAWVQANIASFGGDASRVTLVGQSAGGGSIAAHLVAPSSDSLFAQAIIHSSTMGLWATTLESGIDVGQRAAASLGCDISNRTCFMEASIDALLTAEYFAQNHLFFSHPLSVFLPWNVYADGVLIPTNQLSAVLAGDFQRGKPVMIGNVAQEAVLFIYQASAAPISKIEYEAIVTDIFKEHALDVLAMFPGNATDSRPALALLGTAYIFMCPQRAAAFSIANYARVYTYHFNHIWSFSQAGWGPNYTMCWDAVCHGEELPFLFSTTRAPPQQFTQQELALSEAMMAYWGNFAATGNPNIGPSDVPLSWPTYAEGSLGMMQLATPAVNVINGLLADTCDYFDKIGYENGEGFHGHL